jgi:hypothetical protein
MMDSSVLAHTTKGAFDFHGVSEHAANQYDKLQHI